MTEKEKEYIVDKLQEALEEAENDGYICAKIRRPIVFEAIALLKEPENEPQLVIDKQNLGNCISAFCPNCGRGLYDKNGATKYCYNCGKAVRWK